MTTTKSIGISLKDPKKQTRTTTIFWGAARKDLRKLLGRRRRERGGTGSFCFSASHLCVCSSSYTFLKSTGRTGKKERRDLSCLQKSLFENPFSCPHSVKEEGVNFPLSLLSVPLLQRQKSLTPLLYVLLAGP